MIAMQSRLKSRCGGRTVVRPPEPDRPTAAGSGGLDKYDPEGPPNGPETDPKAAAKALDSASQLSDRLAVEPQQVIPGQAESADGWL